MRNHRLIGSGYPQGNPGIFMALQKLVKDVMADDKLVYFDEEQYRILRQSLDRKHNEWGYPYEADWITEDEAKEAWDSIPYKGEINDND